MIGKKKEKEKRSVTVVANKNEHIWWGLGAAGIVFLGFVMIQQLTSKTNINLKAFDSPDSPESGQCMDKHFIEMLQRVAKITGLPIFKMINSGARTPFWNTKVGGVFNSAHKIPKCQAADIKTPTITIRNKIVMAAKLVGFKRIGIGKTFVHLDNDSSKKQYVAWGYPSGTKPPINPFA